LITYSTRNTTIKKNDLKDVDVVVLADGYNGLMNYALIDAYGHLYTNIYDAYGTGISSTNVSTKQGLDVYVLNPTLPFSLSNDTNYGVVGSNTLRTAAQIGNSTGVADFNLGTIGSQTLRTASHTVDGYGNSISSTVVSGKRGIDAYIINSTLPFSLSNDTNYGTVGANTLRTASQIGNATGAADFNVGIIGAQTLRTASHTVDGYGNRIGSVLDALKVNFTNTTIGVTQNTSPWVVSGTVTANQGGAWTVAATQSGTWTTGRTWTLASGTDSVTVVQGTSPWVISGTVTAAEDKNYGTVGATTLRVASQIGNSTGAANFNYGTVGAQTLRVASQIGNATGAADFNAGNTSAQTLRVVIATNQSAIPVTQSTSPWVISGTVTANQGTSPWVISGTVTAVEDKNYGTVGANTLRVAAQIGNATGAADFNFGASSAQTLRTASNVADGYGNRITSSKHIVQTYHGLDTWDLSGTPQHFNGTVGTTAATITPTSVTTSVLVINPATNPNSALLSVSFDGGTNFTDIERRGTLSITTEVSSFQIKANAANTAYQILVTRR
jgi:hypothetical protein